MHGDGRILSSMTRGQADCPRQSVFFNGAEDRVANNPTMIL